MILNVVEIDMVDNLKLNDHMESAKAIVGWDKIAF